MEFTFHMLLNIEVVKVPVPIQVYMININVKELQQNVFLLNDLKSINGLKSPCILWYMRGDFLWCMQLLCPGDLE